MSMPVLKKGLFILFCLILPHTSMAAALAEALCGKSEASNDGPNASSMKSIEKNMPPVHNQQSAGWCYAFAACDVLNYNSHRTLAKKGPGSYSPKNEIAVIDAVAKQNAFQDEHTEPVPKDFGKIDLQRGGDAFHLLTAMQEVKSVRSQAQVPFYSFEENDDGGRRISSLILTQYKPKKAAEKCSVPAGPTAGFYSINRALAKKAASESNLKSKAQVIENYEQYAKEYGPPEIKIPSIIPHLLETESPAVYLNQIKTILQSGQPAMVSICASQLFELGNDCGHHQMTVVGSGYITTPEGKACNVRLRNSWGANWKDGGYVNVPVEEFLNAFDKKQPFRTIWAEAAQADQALTSVATFAQGPPEYGKEKTYVGTYINARGKSVFNTGTVTMTNGKTYHYLNGKALSTPNDSTPLESKK